MSDAEHATEDVLDLLAEEHREAEQMLEELSSQDKQEHDPRELADRLTASLVRHSVAEEMYVYPAMREHLEDGDAAVEHDISEHQELEELLKRLEGLEQLRFMENGRKVLCVEVEARGRRFWELNNPEDVPRIEAMLAGMGLE